MFFAWSVESCFATDREEQDFFVAQKAFSDGFYDLALDNIEQFIRDYPNSKKTPQAHLLKGKCFFYEDRFNDALLEFKNIETQSTANKIRDALIYWIAETNFKTKNFDAAIALYKELIRDFPQSSYLAYADYSLGWCLFEKGDFLEALNYLKKAREQFPKHALAEDAEFKICQALYNLRDYNLLREELTQFLKKYQSAWKKAQIFFYLAESNYYLQDYTGAINNYLRTIEVSESDSSNKDLIDLAKLGIGWSYIKLNNYQKAQETFNRLPASSAVLFGKATIFSNLKQYQDAYMLYEKLTADYPQTKYLIEALIGRANCLYELNRPQEAINTYEEALDKANKNESIPKDLIYKLRYGLALSYLKSQQPKEAVDEFQKLASVSDDNMVRLSALCQAADTYQDAGQYEKAIGEYKRILQDYPDTSYSDYIQYQLGKSLMSLRQFDAAQLAFNALIANCPQSKLLDEARFQLGMVYFKNGDFVNAKDYFNKFANETSNSQLKNEAIYLVGVSLYNLGKYREAINTLETILKIEPSSGDPKLVQSAEFEIASILYQIGEPKEALKRFYSFINKYPDSNLRADVLLWLGDYFSQRQLFDLARRYLWQLVREHPDSPLLDDAFYYIGNTFLAEQKFDLAAKQFKKVLEFPDTNLGLQASFAIADIYRDQADLDGAIKTCQELIEKRPDSKNIIFEKMADIYRDFKNYPEAINDYIKATELSASSELYFKLADTYEEAGEFDKAQDAYLAIINIYGQDTYWLIKAYLRLARIFENNRKLLDAKKIYEKLSDMNVQESKYAKERLNWIEQRLPH